MKTHKCKEMPTQANIRNFQSVPVLWLAGKMGGVIQRKDKEYHELLETSINYRDAKDAEIFELKNGLITSRLAKEITAEKDNEIAELKKQINSKTPEYIVSTYLEEIEYLKQALRSPAEEIFSELDNRIIGGFLPDWRFKRYNNLKQKFLSGAETEPQRRGRNVPSGSVQATEGRPKIPVGGFESTTRREPNEADGLKQEYSGRKSAALFDRKPRFGLEYPKHFGRKKVKK